MAGAAALLALAGLTKPTALVIAPGFVISALLDPHLDRAARWRAAITLSAGIGLGALAQIGWNIARFGDPLDFGYNLGAMIPVPPARAFTLGEIPRGLFVQLLTHGKSLFVWAPPVLLSALALCCRTPPVKEDSRPLVRTERGLLAGLIAASVAALVFYAAFLFPEGGYAPRFTAGCSSHVWLPAYSCRRWRCRSRSCKIRRLSRPILAGRARTTSASIRRRGVRGCDTGSITCRSRLR
ncbi:MAG: hypothetical protein DMF84_04085 [Acidobacteria bacterium]|nr:MAG: hypothetical protein DMF84_04085 [Acidobacteriota bacterium]